MAMSNSIPIAPVTVGMPRWRSARLPWEKVDTVRPGMAGDAGVHEPNTRDGPAVHSRQDIRDAGIEQLKRTPRVGHLHPVVVTGA